MSAVVEDILEVNLENFQAEVVDKSQQIPILLEFYAEQAEQCVSTSATLKRLVSEYQGKFALRRVEVQKNSQLVQQMQIRALPTIKIVHQGQVAGGIDGPVEEHQLRGALDQLTMSPLERVREEIDNLVSQGQRPQAIAMLKDVIGDEPSNFALHVELCDLLIIEDRMSEAREILEGIPSDSEGIAKPKSRLEFIDMAKELEDLDSLLEKLEAGRDDNYQLKLDAAIKLVTADRVEEALIILLSIVQADRLWEEEKARKTMVKIFDLLGKGNELATRYRRKMFALLH